MEAIKQNKIVIFGAGKIGRSFIGQIFGRGGYEVVFVDVYKPIIEEINKRRNYNVVIKSDKEEVYTITNVRGVLADDMDAVAGEVASAGIVAVSVGLHGLSSIFPSLAKGLEKRFEMNFMSPLDIIIAENMRDADALFYGALKKLLPKEYPFEQLVGLVETSIGKMVPIMLKKDLEADILQVFAEPYNTLILDKKAFKNRIPEISDLAPKENMKAWVDRKLFIHNLGHATAAYVGYQHDPGFVYIYEALAVPAVHDAVRNTMLQSAGILLKKYPGEFSVEELTLHIDDLLFRFKNKSLGDTLFRVGCDLIRKLGPEDRLAGAVKNALLFDLPYDKILYALVCGIHFRAKDESGNILPQDAEFATLCEKGTDHVLSEICDFDMIRHNPVFRHARELNRILGTTGTKSLS